MQPDISPAAPSSPIIVFVRAQPGVNVELLDLIDPVVLGVPVLHETLDYTKDLIRKPTDLQDILPLGDLRVLPREKHYHVVLLDARVSLVRGRWRWKNESQSLATSF